MLKQRVITALVLLAVLLPAIFYSNPLPFVLIVLAMLVAGSWEWARLNHLSNAAAIGTAILTAVVAVTGYQLGWVHAPHFLLWIMVGAAWVLASAALIKGGVASWARIPLSIRWIGGLVALWTAGVAMVQARAIGVNFLFSVLTLVWVADIFAYFFGRALGLRFTESKLAPAISPGKSWEGAWGGAFGVLVLAFAWVWLDVAVQSEVASFYTRLWASSGWMLLVAVLFMAAMSVVGDLVESLIKRSAGVKDSSQLLPGHGGVLDRIDALLPTLPLAMMLTSLVQ
jgi:phosphatidate cytidylyltransferase